MNTKLEALGWKAPRAYGEGSFTRDKRNGRWIYREVVDGVRVSKSGKTKAICKQRMKEHIRYVSPDVSHQGDFIFKSDYVNHLFKELPKTTLIPGYPHTPEGQAKFFRDVIPRMYNLPFVGGTIVYCYADSEKCYMCDQPDCPTETRWGLVDVDGNEKPSYYAVRKAFGRIRGKCPY